MKAGNTYYNSYNFFANLNPKTLGLYLFIAGILCGCTKEDLPTPPKAAEYAHATADSAFITDSLTPAQMVTVLEHAFLIIDWGVYGLIDSDSFQAVANNNHYTDVRIRTPGLPENLATLLWMPCDYHTIREILIQHIDNLKSNDKRVRGMGKVYTERHDLPNDYEIHPGSNPCGMSIEDFEWFTENGWIVVDTSLYKSPKAIWLDTISWNNENNALKKNNGNNCSLAKRKPLAHNCPLQQKLLKSQFATLHSTRQRYVARNLKQRHA